MGSTMASGAQSVMRVEDYLTHIDNVEDVPFLKTKLLDVNMRLFKSSPKYRVIVGYCCKYIAALAVTTMRGYKKPHGMSGANAAIPYNIIAYVRNRGMEDEEAVIMINPKVVHASVCVSTVMSNCGSIRLPEPIPVKRAMDVDITWFDEEGIKHSGRFYQGSGGFTLQHEIDHNLGILITDRQVNP